jgi:hypothetical protein
MHEDLDQALRRIDEALGAGYAKGHPELVAALVHTARLVACVSLRSYVQGTPRRGS